MFQLIVAIDIINYSTLVMGIADFTGGFHDQQGGTLGLGIQKLAVIDLIWAFFFTELMTCIQDRCRLSKSGSSKLYLSVCLITRCARFVISKLTLCAILRHLLCLFLHVKALSTSMSASLHVKLTLALCARFQMGKNGGS